MESIASEMNDETEEHVGAWVCDLWDSALKIDSSAEWRAAWRTMFGAQMASLQATNMADYDAYSTLNYVAFEHLLIAMEEDK